MAQLADLAAARDAPALSSGLKPSTGFGWAQVFDAVAQLADLAAAPDGRAARGKPLRQAPRQAHAHAAEGYALDWSRAAPGRLASGDCAGAIHVWEPTDKGGWLVGGAHQVGV